jgi:ferric-dicitrate binding protein FerR (iron transport regulator)
MTENGMLRPGDDQEDDGKVERLLGLAGARPGVSPLRTERVRANVRLEWQRGAQRRAFKKRIAFVTALGAAAALLAVAAGMPVFERDAAVRGEAVAIVERVDGAGDGLRGGQSVAINEQIETADASRMALRFSDGTSLRIDARTRLRVLSASAIELTAGAVYVDTGTEHGRFEVRTALATARDIGTQFEVRLLDSQLRLRVRTGVVELRDEARSISGRSGTEILLSASGAVSRPVAVHGTHWEWIARLAPRVEMEGQSLAAFLERTAHEQGWTIEYRDPTVEREASRTVLHGSVDGLAPADAVAVAVATSGLGHQLDRGTLAVFRRDTR